MSDKAGSYSVVEMSLARRVMVNMLALPRPKHQIFGLLELDVTAVRKFLADHKAATGETLSFTGYLTFCLAQAVNEHKEVQAYLKGRKRLVKFDDVNVGLMVEKKVGDKRAVTGHVISGANYKTYLDIHREIRRVQSKPAPPDSGRKNRFFSSLLVSWPLSSLFRGLFGIVMRTYPAIYASRVGTVGVSAVGMFGEGHSGWGVAPLPYSLGLIIGSIAWKPAVVEGRVEPREILNLTVVFDHDIVDGAPAARFMRRFTELVESSYGLDVDQPTVDLEREPAELRRSAAPV